MRKPAAALAVLLAAVTIAVAANRHVTGTAHVITIDLGDGAPETTALVLGEAAAAAVYEGMTGVPTTSYENTCEDKRVRVEERRGASFSCERWPDTCWAKPYYKCEASLDLVQGRAVAR